MCCYSYIFINIYIYIYVSRIAQACEVGIPKVRRGPDPEALGAWTSGVPTTVQ